MENLYCLFDLDGTLTDPKEGITNSVRYALSKLGIREDDRERLVPFIGPPLRETFRERYGFSAEEAERAVGFYREYFSDCGIFENEVYSGIPELLGSLKKEGASLFVATSKPTVYAEKIAERFGLAGFFAGIVGSELDGKRSDKAEVIRFVLERFAVPFEEAVMVGDRKHDILGARANGAASVGVLWGYGGEEELHAAGADRLCRTPGELREVLAAGSRRIEVSGAEGSDRRSKRLQDLQRDRWDRRYAESKKRETITDDWLEAYRGELEKARAVPIIDLGCGAGNDTKYLLERGFRVIACDYSAEAAALIRERFPAAETRLFDMKDGLPFPDASAEALVADLSIHYFDWAATMKIVREIARVLAEGGLFLCRVNSTEDVNHGAGQGELLERNYYLTEAGPKRFFSGEDIDELFGEGWVRIAAAEKVLCRYEAEKRLWEIALRKASRPGS